MRFRVWLPNVILALAVAAFVIPFPVASHAQEGCMPLENFTSVIDRLPVFRILTGDRLVKAAQVFNAFPPESDTQWTSAYFALFPDGSGLLMVGMGDTICEKLVISKPNVFLILSIIDGVQA